MRRNSFFKLCTLAMTVVMACAVSSCCDTKEDDVFIGDDTPVIDNTPVTGSSYRSTNVVPDGYNFGIVNEENGNSYIVANEGGDPSGEIGRIGFRLNRKGVGEDPNNYAVSNGTAIFADRRVRSVTINGVTYTFHKNDKDKVDVAITCNSISELFTDVAESQLLGGDGGAGGSFSQKLSNAFANIYSATGIITSANALVDPNSPLYPYVRDVDAYLAMLKGDTEKLKDDTVAEDLVNKVTNQPADFDNSDIQATDSIADENTNKGNGAIASGKGALKVTLTWFFISDIDLHVYEPDYNSGSVGHIWYSQPRNSFTDGYLDIDNTRGYYINPITGETNANLSAVENIYWPENPKSGKFDIYLDNYSHMASGMCNLTIYKDGVSLYSENIWMDTNDRSRYIVSVTMPQGEITTQTRAAVTADIADYRMFPAKK